MVNDRDRVTIYTDGGADPNPGPGGWGAVLIHDASGNSRQLSGGDPQATNNRMELTAAIRALEALNRPCAVTLFTDSEYVMRGMTEYLSKWQANGWKSSKKNDIENIDLWQALVKAAEPHSITWEWVRGHAGNRYNEIADKLASAEIRKIQAMFREEGFDGAEIFTMVSARGATGCWAALVRFDGEEDIQADMETQTTSNRLDIMAAATALSLLPDGIAVRIYTFSDYLRNGATKWMEGWMKRDWLTKEGEPVKNADAWEWLHDEMAIRQVSFPIVKADDPPEAFETLQFAAQDVFEALTRDEGGEQAVNRGDEDETL